MLEGWFVLKKLQIRNRLNDLRDQKNDAQWRGGVQWRREIGWVLVVAGQTVAEKKPTGGGL
jgi:hypothetical protein